MKNTFEFMTRDRNGKKVYFEQNSLAEFARKLPHNEVMVYDLKTCKPVGLMNMCAVFDKYA